MSFVRFLTGRLAAALLLVFLVASSAQILAQLAQGDYYGRLGADADFVRAQRQRLGLDLPFGEQYARWMRRTVTLDLGDSFKYQRPVLDLVRERAGNTARLAIAALAVATMIGIPCGIVTGSRRRGAAVRAIESLSLLLLSVPPFISSLVLLTIAAATGWLPVSGMRGPSSFVIPTIALALPLAAALERLQSQSIAEALDRPSTLAARARGLPLARVVWRHGWRQSLGPLLAIYGVIVGSLFSGSFAVEIVTSWPGLAMLMSEAMSARDTYLVAGCAAAGALFLAAAVLASDVAHALADPRVVIDEASRA